MENEIKEEATPYSSNRHYGDSGGSMGLSLRTTKRSDDRSGRPARGFVHPVPYGDGVERRRRKRTANIAERPHLHSRSIADDYGCGDGRNRGDLRIRNHGAPRQRSQHATGGKFHRGDESEGGLLRQQHSTRRRMWRERYSMVGA